MVGRVLCRRQGPVEYQRLGTLGEGEGRVSGEVTFLWRLLGAEDCVLGLLFVLFAQSCEGFVLVRGRIPAAGVG